MARYINTERTVIADAKAGVAASRSLSYGDTEDAHGAKLEQLDPARAPWSAFGRRGQGTRLARADDHAHVVAGRQTIAGGWGWRKAGMSADEISADDARRARGPKRKVAEAAADYKRTGAHGAKIGQWLHLGTTPTTASSITFPKC